MVRKDEVGLVADEQPAGHVDAERLDLIDLRKERVRIDDDAVADDAGDARMQDARRNQVQDEFLAADVHRMAGVVSALIPRND
jgi:hypothetical protein